jgi:ribosome recycling factor
MAAAPPFELNDYSKRMDGAIETLRHEFSGLRTGRATAALLDPITVEAYGTMNPINQVASVTAPEPRMLSVQIWDKAIVSAVDKAVRAAGLGLNPIVDGMTLRIPIPPLTGERRTELAKLAGKYAEQTRVAVRNVRRDAMEHLKRLEKEKQISEDDHKKRADEVQKKTDQHIRDIDALLGTKEGEIMQV